jgi:phosphoenolpyruvate-protein kinase (PTS system EI component)
MVFGGWGSPFDHIGIVAREMGIAAVFDVNDVGRIKDGDIVEILGASGEVRVTPGAGGS